MAKKDELLFGRDPAEISELVLDGVPSPVADAKNYVLQPTSADIPETLSNVPEHHFQEQVLKGSDEAKEGAVDAHPEENQPA